MSTLQDAVKKLITTQKYNDKVVTVLQLVSDGKMRLPDVEAALALIKVKRITDLKDKLVDVLFDYINLCLEDDVLTLSEMQDFNVLQRFFRIQEGDFIRCHKEREIKDVLTAQLRKIQSDKVVDKSEALMKNDLQAMFGLSYDQFLEIENEVSKESIKGGANPLNLDTFIKK